MNHTVFACAFLFTLAVVTGAQASDRSVSPQEVASHSARPPENRISMDQAQKIATGVQAGHVESKELEHEHGKWIYSFDIRAKNRIHEIQVDARNGKIVSNMLETPAEEAKEAAAENK